MRRYALSLAAIKKLSKWWQFFIPRYFQGILTEIVWARNGEDAQEQGLVIVRRVYPASAGWQDHKCGIREI